MDTVAEPRMTAFDVLSNRTDYAVRPSPRYLPGTTDDIDAVDVSVRASALPDWTEAFGARSTRSDRHREEMSLAQTSVSKGGAVGWVQALALSGAREAFARLLPLLVLVLDSAEALRMAIDICLESGFDDIAAELARYGERRFPDSRDIRKRSLVLAPPTVKPVTAPPRGGPRCNQSMDS